MPAGFAFAVKAPKEITHRRRLANAGAELEAFLAQIGGLGERLGPLLFQLSPSLAFDRGVAEAFFAALRARFEGSAVCEPRHPDWLTSEADDVLKAFRIGRVAADPPLAFGAADPGGWGSIRYFRLHGSPRRYYSDYDADALERIATALTRAGMEGDAVWCIFDNTAAGAATANALALQVILGRRGRPTARHLG